MNTLWVRIQAPFAAYRWMQAGSYRASFPTMPPSAAYGLLLNFAGIEMRDPNPGVATLIKQGLPPLQLAIGNLQEPKVSTLYQQLHSYPVGNSGKELAPLTKGAKFWIAPARREVLVGLDVLLGVQSDDTSVVEKISRGIKGELSEARYGLPFAGDNNLLIDRVELLDSPCRAHWYTAIGPDSGPMKGSCRLTQSIDRADNSKTRTILVAPRVQETPPTEAWFWVPKAS